MVLEKSLDCKEVQPVHPKGYDNRNLQNWKAQGKIEQGELSIQKLWGNYKGYNIQIVATWEGEKGKGTEAVFGAIKSISPN